MLLIATQELGSGSERNLQNTVTEVFGKVIYGRRTFICPFGRLVVTTLSSPPPALIPGRHSHEGGEQQLVKGENPRFRGYIK